MESDVFPSLSLTARAVTYYLMALAMCTALAVYWPNGESAAVLAMLTPVLSVLVMQLVVTRDGWRKGGWTSLGLGRLGTRVWGLAVGLPALVLVVSEAAVRLTGLTSWELPSASDAALLGIEVPVLLVFCLFEEIGWRGYLSPLMDARGTRAPQLQVGLLHGIWHLPLVFLATDSYLTDGSRWVVVPLFLAVITASGPIYGRLRRSTGSVYPAVLLHASFNWMLGFFFYTVSTSAPDTVALLGREAGIATLVTLVGAAVWLTTRPDSASPVTAPAPVLTRSH